jgi:alpha-tubulin suppressor-like RCC1 family protein
VECWGFGDYGDLGDNSVADSPPVAVAGLSSGVSAITAGEYHTCALTTAGAALCWGDNASGELGNNSATSEIHAPVGVVEP